MSNTIITSIDSNYTKDYFTGLNISTDKGDIQLLIDTHQQCCENWGCKFLDTPDEPSNFIGATILSIESIDLDATYGWETQIKIVTDHGVLQYAVYNEHNGYYCHAAITKIYESTKQEYI